MTQAQWTIGSVQQVIYSAARRFGYGFNVVDRRGAPVVSLAFETKEDAESAAANLRGILEKTVDVTSYAPL